MPKATQPEGDAIEQADQEPVVAEESETEAIEPEEEDGSTEEGAEEEAATTDGADDLLPELNPEDDDDLDDGALASPAGALTPEKLALIPDEGLKAEVKDAYQARDMFLSWVNALDDPASAPLALKQVIQTSAERTGRTFDQMVQELTGKAIAPAAQGAENSEGETEAEFEYETDKLVYERAKADAKREIMDELKDVIGPVKDLVVQRQAAQQDAENQKKAEQIAPLVAEKLKTDFPHAQITADMVAKAIRRLPNEKPVQAVRMAYEKYLHDTNYKQGREKKGPSRIASGRTAGTPAIDPATMTVQEHARALQGI